MCCSLECQLKRSQIRPPAYVHTLTRTTPAAHMFQAAIDNANNRYMRRHSHTPPNPSTDSFQRWLRRCRWASGEHICRTCFAYTKIQNTHARRPSPCLQSPARMRRHKRRRQRARERATIRDSNVTNDIITSSSLRRRRQFAPFVCGRRSRSRR